MFSCMMLYIVLYDVVHRLYGFLLDLVEKQRGSSKQVTVLHKKCFTRLKNTIVCWLSPSYNMYINVCHSEHHMD